MTRLVVAYIQIIAILLNLLRLRKLNQNSLQDVVGMKYCMWIFRTSSMNLRLVRRKNFKQKKIIVRNLFRDMLMVIL